MVRNLIDLSRKLGTKLTSRALVEACFSHIEQADGEGERVFLSRYKERACIEADQIDRARSMGWSVPPFAGVPISIKDLFDVVGEVTRAGSRVLDEQPIADRDAAIVTLLRRAGFIIIGKTNMTEFAYSGLGMNSHFGTPRGPWQREVGRIPGGSSSGGAVSVSDEMAPATIGTDTGGSCRIPAAFCGIVGLKPTSMRVSREGAIPLSRSLDSIGPLAGSVSCCAVLDSILSGGDGVDEESHAEGGIRLGVLEGYVVAEMDETVARSYSAVLTRLSQRGVRLTPVTIPELSELPEINRKGGLVGAEAYAWHQAYLETRGEYYDPWIRARFAIARQQSAADYIALLDHRVRIGAAFRRKAQQFDALILPTVQITPPEITALREDDELANRVNLLCLRNTSIGNFLDRPSISIPCHEPGAAPVGMMLMGESKEDRKLLSIARGLEYTIRGSRL